MASLVLSWSPSRGLLSASSLLGIAIIAILFFLTIAKLLQWAIPDQPELRAGALCFVLFLPQFSFIGGGVNNDNLINLLYAATVIACIKVASKKSIQWIGLLLLLVIACVLTKKTGLAAIPLAVVSILHGYRLHRHMIIRSLLIAVCLLGALLLAQAFLTWYSPEIARKTVATAYHNLWKQLASTPNPGGDQTLGVTAIAIWQSFWASFGWLRIGPPPWLYGPTLAVHAAMAAGGILAMLEFGGFSSGKLGREAARIRAILSFSGVLILVAVVIRNLNEFQPQGRYLLPALPALALCLAMGMSLAPPRTRRWLIIVFVGWFCFFELTTLFGYAIPLFYDGVM